MAINLGMIRVLIVDDSAFMRHVLSREIGGDAGLEVVGAARDGIEALEMIPRLNPDVITLDVEMPRMDGLETLQRIMADKPRHVVMLSSLTKEGSATTLRALELGAVDFVAKPSGSLSVDIHKVREELRTKIKDAARSVNLSAFAQKSLQASRLAPATALRNSRTGISRTSSVGYRGAVIIGSSTGGPRALSSLVPNLRPDFPLPVLIVQHMPTGFTRSLAERLDGMAGLVVREAQDGDLLQPGLALLAPGGFHMEVRRDRRVSLNENPTVHGVRPSVDSTLKSAARNIDGILVAAILTGMGYDGTDGARAIRNVGGRVIAEHQSTCVVYGMPRSVVEAGLANAVPALPGIAGEIENQISALSC